MDFSWQPHTLELIKAYSDFAKSFLANRPAVHGIDKESWQACSQQGVLRLLKGGNANDSDSSLLQTSAVFEALGRQGADRGFLFALGAHLFGCQWPIMVHGRDEHSAWIEGLASGCLIGALAVTEPSSGSNPGKMDTQAVPEDDRYRLNGRKTFVTNAPEADLFLVVATTNPDVGSFGWTAFLVERETPGLSVEKLSTAGLAGAPMGTVTFDNCLLEQKNLLGKMGGGLKVFTTAMLWERTGILASFIGAAEHDLAACAEFSGTRRDADGPISAHQSVSHRLARAKLRLDRSRLMLQRAAWAVDTKQKNALQAVAMSKLEVSETIVETAMDIMRITAGAGWTGHLGAAAALSDTLGTLFASGTAEIQLNIIAASMGLKRR